MAIGGTLEYEGKKYFIALDQTANINKWMLVSPVAKAQLAKVYAGNITGEDDVDEITLGQMVTRAAPLEHVLEILKIHKYTNKSSVYGPNLVLRTVLEQVDRALFYSFAEDDIHANQRDPLTSTIHFEAEDSNLSLSFVKENGIYKRLQLTNSSVKLDMLSRHNIKFPRKVEMTDLKKEDLKEIQQLSVDALDLESLRKIVDLSWYFNEDGTKKKDYFPVRNIPEFEEKVMTPILNELKVAMSVRSKPLDFSLDIETTGLNMYSLSPNNPMKDRITCIILSWQDDQSALIFTEMQAFENIDANYVAERLRPILEMNAKNLDVKVTHRRVWKSEEGYRGTTYEWEDYGEFIFNRKMVNINGHNVMFDGRGLLDLDITVEWMYDTLQLGFLMHPRAVRGANKLKTMIERILNVHAPELSTILGKGNEGNFHKIRDLEVALIYGGSDTDNHRKLLRELLRMMPPKLLLNYKRFDKWLLNRLPKSEYLGLPIDEAYFRKNAEVNMKDIELMQEFAFQYVGRFLSVKNKRNVLLNQMQAGLITKEQYEEGIVKVRPEPNARYVFKLSGNELRAVLYDILGYPDWVRTTPSEKHPQGQPALNKTAFRKWYDKKRETMGTYLKSDFMSSDGKTKLMKMEDFNERQYPMAYFLQVYSGLIKDQSGYFDPILEGNMEGRIFRSFSLARIETLRIMNSAQTMKKKHKYGVVSLGPDWYLMDFDQASAEPKIFISRSDDEAMKEKYRDPENDYHTENAANILHIPPHKLTKILRGLYKVYTLGIPYGIGDDKMAEQTFGNKSRKSLYETRKNIEAWIRGNFSAYQKLLETRREALTPAELPEGLKEFLRKINQTDKDLPYGKVENDFGFHRLFDLSKMDGSRGAIGKIERPSGNYGIQSLAAGIFRMILKNLMRRCIEEGIDEQVVWHMLIHDELLFSVHKSIHPILMYKIIHESCTITLEGHTTYFVGINIGDSWGECKEDESEAPVKFVQRLIKRWDAGEFREDDYWNYEFSYVTASGKTKHSKGPKAYMMRHMLEYIKVRISEEVLRLQSSASKGLINLPQLLEVFDRYMVRSYVTMYYPVNGSLTKEQMEDEDLVYQRRFESWILDFFGDGVTLIGMDGEKYKVFKRPDTVSITLDLFDEDDEDEVEDDEDFSLEDDYNANDEFGGYSVVDYEAMRESESEDILEKYKAFMEGRSLEVADRPQYNCIQPLGERLYIDVKKMANVNKLKQHLISKKAAIGLKVVIKTLTKVEHWITIDSTIDLQELDDFVSDLTRVKSKVAEGRST